MAHSSACLADKDIAPLVPTIDGLPKKKSNKWMFICCLVFLVVGKFLSEGHTAAEQGPQDVEHKNMSSRSSTPQKKDLDICSFSQIIDLNGPCKKRLNEKKRIIFGDRTQGRVLMFGDSTTFWLGQSRSMRAVRSASQIKDCNPNYRCTQKNDGKCIDRPQIFNQQRAAIWNPPNPLLGEGPHSNETEKHFCTDCMGCSIGFTVCTRSKSTDTSKDHQSCRGSDDKILLHGGYIPIEFARDVELQTPDVSTTQEVIATFLRESYNTAPQVEDFGMPICVVNTGHHDVLVATRAKFIENIKWYMGILLPQCSMIVWITTTAPEASSIESAPQHQVQTKSWNDGVVQGFREEASNELLDKLFVVDVFTASVNYTHRDNLHLAFSWYDILGTFLYEAFSEL